MHAIVPRWEWRTWEPFGDAGQRLEALATDPPQVSDEVYVLALASEASVKVRDGLMDVKRLEHVDDDGLEQWRPVTKAPFPLARADVVGLLDALAVAAGLERDEYTLDELLAEVLRPRADVRVVAVHKERARFTLGGCMAELSELRTDHGSARTLAIESEDADGVIAAVRELGLASRHNVSVPRKLKALAGFAGRRYAVIDVGTNSVKFHIGERAADGGWQAIVDRAEVTRLGQDLDSTGRLGEEAIRRTTDAIAGMAEEAARHDVESIVAVGTAGLRLAPNRAALIDAVRQVHGVDVEVIPGEEEAALAYRAAASALDIGDGTVVVFDTGGGSSQFTIGRGTHVQERFSLDVGAVRYTERFGLDAVVDGPTLSATLAALATDLARLDGHLPVQRVVGMGGAVTNLAAVKHGLAVYDPDVVQGTVLDRAEIDRQIELYRTRDAEQRHAIVGLQANRAAVILAGACIVRSILTKLGCDALTVSDRGLRHGLIVERFPHRPTRPPPDDVRPASAGAAPR
jgi:exopolyphosphatase / guanosine-5'-triphosphate,3'-diphosphate pyrophosphatase